MKIPSKPPPLAAQAPVTEAKQISQGSPPREPAAPTAAQRQALAGPRAAQMAPSKSVPLSPLEQRLLGVEAKETYAPPNRYLWDSWVLKDGDTYRLYHLDAPMTADPEARHDLARIRGAVSKDMQTWEDVGEILGPGPSGAWDDKAIWTGDTFRHDGKYLLFYTGRNQRDGQTQRIGLATSTDGIHFERGKEPLLEPDARWYETDEPSPIYKAWRDPTVVYDDSTGKYLMYFTAKTKDGDEKYKGCIGLAVADNMQGPYEAQPPVLAPGIYAQMEVPQIIQRGGKVYLLFNSAEKDYSPELAKKTGGPQSGLVAFVGDSLRGPFEPMDGHGVVLGSEANLYTVKLQDDPERPGEYVAYGWYMEDQPGQKAMTLSQPMPVNFEGERMLINHRP